MTKGVLIEAILLQVSGGTLSYDNNVWREDIAAYLPAVIAEAAKMDAFQKRQEARADAAIAWFYEVYPALEFYKEVVATPVLDEATEKYYVVLPSLLDLPYNWNVMSARPEQSFDVDYLRLRTPQELIGMDPMGQTFYWVIKRGKVNRAYFSELPFPIQDVALLVAASPDGLEDGDELPIPAGMENHVIQTAVAFFRNQTMTPADPLLDDKGINDTPAMANR